MVDGENDGKQQYSSFFHNVLYPIKYKYRPKSLPNDIFFGTRQNLTHFGVDKINVPRLTEFDYNAGDQHFLLFPQCFQKASSSGSLKLGIV